jgi:hypothetical protein
MLEYNKNFFYPVGVNTNVLLNLDEPDTAIQSQIKRITDAGANTLRVSIDQAFQGGQPVKENRDGTLPAPLVNRLELLCNEAAKQSAIVTVSIFDLQHMAESWKTHPYNSSNGGDCDDPQSFFTNPQRRKLSLNRIKQIIHLLQPHDNVIFELARGINLDEWKSIGDSKWRQHIHQWTSIMLDTFRRDDNHDHLIALSYLPNTTPYDLMKFAMVDLSFLHIKSHNSLVAVQSTKQLITLAREISRPVFIGELTWSGDSNQSIHYQQMMLWSMLAAGSSAFLHTGNDPVSSAELEQFKQFRFAMPLFDLSGTPRPPAKPAPSVFPPDSYVMIEHITGYDWIICMIRKSPGKESTQVSIPIQNGWYEYQWFQIEKGQITPNQKRHNSRGLLQLQTPEMEQIIIGRLRYLPDEEPITADKDQTNRENSTNETEE